MDGIDSIENYCRICASNSPDARNIFEVVYKEMLLSDILGKCLQCTIYKTEYLPEYICSQCCADLIKMYKFIANYEKSEKWFMSRYNAMNEARLIETVCPMEFEQNPEIPVEPKHEIFTESLANTVPIQELPLNLLEVIKCEVAALPTSVVPVQDPSPNPLELNEEFDNDYEFEMAEFPASPSRSDFETQELNGANYHEQDSAAAEYEMDENNGTAKYRKRYSVSISLKNHKILHTGPKSYECYFCEKKYRLSSSRNTHILEKHPDLVFECFECKTKFSAYDRLIKHMKEVIHLNTLSAKDSIKSLKDMERKGLPWNIIIGADGIKRFKCNLCDKEYDKKNTLTAHNWSRHREGRFKCNNCSEICASKSDLTEHEKSHFKSFECFDCKKMFKRFVDLRWHIKEHSTEESNQSISYFFGINKDTVRALETTEYQCGMCSKQYSTLYLLERHQNVHTGAKSYECYFCKKKYLFNSSRHSHIVEKHPDHVFECFVCKSKFKTYDKLSKHMTTGLHNNILSGDSIKNEPWMNIIIGADGIKRFKCNLCDKEYDKKNSLTQHHWTRHRVCRFKCNNCSKMFMSKFLLDQHRRTHLTSKCAACERVLRGKKRLRAHMEKCAPHLVVEEKTFDCTICDRKFDDEKKFEYHKKRHNKCEHCPESFSTKEILEDHLLMAHADELSRGFSCRSCTKAFPLKSLLKLHAPQCTKQRDKHLCADCGKFFESPSLLENHRLSVHLSERFSCDLCKGSFTTKGSLIHHVRALHAKTRNYSCDLCEASYSHHGSLRSHKMFKHYNNRPFACNSCSKTFVSKYKLEIHTRIHTGERPFKCLHCDRAFTQKGDMTKHMLIHLGPTPHKCTECGESFRLETELRKHSYGHYEQPTME